MVVLHFVHMMGVQAAGTVSCLSRETFVISRTHAEADESLMDTLGAVPRLLYPQLPPPPVRMAKRRQK